MGGGTFQKILEVLDELRYDVTWKVYNSKDYGVPQNRERVFIKGCLRGRGRFKVLFKPRIDRKVISSVDGKMSSTSYGVRQGRIHKPDEIMNTLTCTGENGGGSQLIQLNNNRKTTQSERVYDSDGLAITLNAAANNGLYKVDKSPIKEKKIKKVGNVARDGRHWRGDVYSDDGISRTLTVCDYKDPMKVCVSERKIKKVGSTNGGQGGNTYDPNGLSPTLCAGDMSHNGGINILEKDRKIKKVGNVYNGGQLGDVFDPDGISPTFCAGHSDSPIKIRTNTKKEHKIKPVLTPDRKNKRQNGRRIKEDGEPMFTLTAQDKHGVTDGISVRKLTPVECERLQGFEDGWTEYGNDGEEISDTQRYKCCGNAVTTNVITAIVDEMFDEVE